MMSYSKKNFKVKDSTFFFIFPKEDFFISKFLRLSWFQQHTQFFDKNEGFNLFKFWNFYSKKFTTLKLKKCGYYNHLIQ